MTATRMLLSLVLLSAVTACSSTISVRHRDPTSPPARIFVDDELVGTVSYGDSIDVAVEAGSHTIAASAASASPWIDSDAGIVVDVGEHAVTLTLHPQVANNE